MQHRVLQHSAFWLSYIAFKVLQNINADLAGQGILSWDTLKISFLSQLVFLIVKVPMVYTLFFITEKYLAKRWTLIQSLFAAALLFLLSLAAFLPVKQFIVLKGIYKINVSLSDALNFTSILSSLFILFFVSSVALAIKLVRSSNRQKKTEQEIITRKLEMELQFLKAQTNPHFLFNTLNNIYALARKRSPDTAEIVMKLSKLLRFMLYESQKERISIADELQVLDDYIELEKIRYSPDLKFSFSRSIDNEMQLIAPLILLPFVENGFKHGASENRFGTEINMRLELAQGQLFFQIQNSKSKDIPQFPSQKLGLKNIRRQLELLYPSHSLAVENEASHFTVTLKINLLKDATV